MRLFILLAGTLVLALPARADEKAPAPSLPLTALPTVKCLRDLLKSSPAVQSADVYVVDEGRSAIEFRFKGKEGNDIIGDLMLRGPFPKYGMTYDITIPRNEPSAAGWESTDFVSSLNVNSKCGVTPAFDSMVPRPKRRTEWQLVDPSTLLPSAIPSPH